MRENAGPYRCGLSSRLSPSERKPSHGRICIVPLSGAPYPPPGRCEDPSSASHLYADDLVAPQPVRANLPAHVKLFQLLIACVLDRSGSLKKVQLLEQTGSSNQILAPLSSWKFRPAFRGDEPIEVTALLGFGVMRLRHAKSPDSGIYLFRPPPSQAPLSWFCLRRRPFRLTRGVGIGHFSEGDT